MLLPFIAPLLPDRYPLMTVKELEAVADSPLLQHFPAVRDCKASRGTRKWEMRPS